MCKSANLVEPHIAANWDPSALKAVSLTKEQEEKKHSPRLEQVIRHCPCK